MALIKCPECGREVSTEAKTCPGCGFPVAQQLPAATKAPPDELLAEVRPSWWTYFWLLLFFWLIIPWLIAWAKRSSTVLRVYRHRITLRRGLLSRDERELFMRDIRSVDVSQSLFSRLVGIGNLTIFTAATKDGAEFIQGIPHPQKIRDLIIAQRQNQ